MTTFSTFHSIALRHFLHPKTRPCLSLSRTTVTQPVSLETPRAFHLTAPRKVYMRNGVPVIKETEEEKKAKAQARKASEARAREIGLRGKRIPYERVRVRERGILSDPRRLSDVLAEIKALNLREARAAQDAEASSPSSFKIRRHFEAELIMNDFFPVITIIDSKAVYAKKKRTQEKVKNSSANNVTKEVQLTWASSIADVENKVEKMKDDLQKGYKIDLAISPKKGVRPPTSEQIEERIQGIVSELMEFGREWQERELTNSTAVVYLQGIAVPSETTKKDTGSVPKSVLLKEERKKKLEERLKKKAEREAKFAAATLDSL